MRVDFLEHPSGSAGYGLDNAPRCPSRVAVTTQPNRPVPAINPGLALLTDGQRDCLRHVYNHMTSKDIARVLGVSPHTVDMRLRTAMRTLNVVNRIDAARLLVQDEAGGVTTPDTYQPLIYQAPELVEPADLPTMASPGSTDGPVARSGDSQLLQPKHQDSPVVDPLVNGPPRLADASMTAEAMSLAASPRSIAVDAGSFDPGAGIHPTEPGKGLSKPWGARNDLAVGARLTWIFLIAVGSALAFGAILSALAALKTLI